MRVRSLTRETALVLVKLISTLGVKVIMKDRHVARRLEVRSRYKNLVGKPDGKAKG
jgi:hypothetical protein